MWPNGGWGRTGVHRSGVGVSCVVARDAEIVRQILVSHDAVRATCDGPILVVESYVLMRPFVRDELGPGVVVGFYVYDVGLGVVPGGTSIRFYETQPAPLPGAVVAVCGVMQYYGLDHFCAFSGAIQESCSLRE